MDHLLREKAPISDEGWNEIEEEAGRTLRNYLAARKLIDYTADPAGWSLSSICLGRVAAVANAPADVRLKTRLVQPITEIRVPFEMSRAELEALDRGATDFDTQPVIDAARAGARVEDSAIFSGNDDMFVKGIGTTSPHDVLQIRADFSNFLDAVATGQDVLQKSGIQGPYALALGPDCWTAVMESSENGGYPLLKHLRLMLDGPVVWAPSLTGAVLLSQRGGDYEIIGGQDWSIGYLHHDLEVVNLYLEETFTARLNTPEAALRFEVVG